ncbi:DUF4176 domain-containing protein [Listeria booriae]|uniref:DUF4176 domain-containing protein n=1 Tax=Listeria booriae TaxID=1552123 RepID=UPI001624963E|nr:DUF4176 domain-containing protein [Listeria booriae]MBC1888074.1 DUF4176 domain-containing protein [Listeria booriae]
MEIKKEVWQDYLYQKVREQLRSNYGKDMELQVHKWLVHYKNDCLFLYNVHGLFNDTPTTELKDEQRNIGYKMTADSLIIVTNLSTSYVPKIVAKQAIQLICDYLQDYLPLGSVVTLDKKYLGKAFTTDSIQQVRFVITQRLACIPNTKTFYQYGGIVYPVGQIDAERVLYFTPPLIEQVQHIGFYDDIELAFILEMKEELLKAKGYQSITFVDAKKREQAQQVIEQRGRY